MLKETALILSEMLEESGMKFYPIDGFHDNYEISECGVIRYRNKKGNPVKLTLVNTSSKQEMLESRKNREIIAESVPRIMIRTFSPNTELDSRRFHVKHKDGNNLNNAINNLQVIRRTANGDPGKGHRKLTIRKARVIRELYKVGVSVANIANSFNVKLTTIYNIINNKTHKEPR